MVRGEVNIKKAVDALTRFHDFHMNARLVARDIEVAGIQLKEGDILTLSGGAANRDPDKPASGYLGGQGKVIPANLHLRFTLIDVKSCEAMLAEAAA